LLVFVWFGYLPFLEICQSLTLAYGGLAPVFSGSINSTAAPSPRQVLATTRNVAKFTKFRATDETSLDASRSRRYRLSHAENWETGHYRCECTYRERVSLDVTEKAPVSSLRRSLRVHKTAFSNMGSAKRRFPGVPRLTNDTRDTFHPRSHRGIAGRYAVGSVVSLVRPLPLSKQSATRCARGGHRSPLVEAGYVEACLSGVESSTK
jgi:hypothetical protein